MNNTTTCPECGRQLRIPESLTGKALKCPACRHTFTPEPDKDEPAPRIAERLEPAAVEPLDRGRRDEDLPEPVEEWRVRRRKDEDDFDDERDERRRKRRRGFQDDLVEHRGTLILILGICSFVIFPIPFGPIAWIFGNNDIKEIRAGRMDPEGENTTQIGRYMGMASTLLTLFCTVLLCGIVGVFILAASSSTGAISLSLTRIIL
jgi:hypothetical protein